MSDFDIEAIRRQYDDAKKRLEQRFVDKIDKLKRGAPAYDVKVERDGFTLIGKPDHIDEFSDIVREAGMDWDSVAGALSACASRPPCPPRRAAARSASSPRTWTLRGTVVISVEVRAI